MPGPLPPRRPGAAARSSRSPRDAVATSTRPGLHVLEVRHVSFHLTHHFRDALRPPAAHARDPFELLPDLRVQLVPPVGFLLDQTLSFEIRQERIDGSGGRPPPALRHLLDRIDDLGPVLRGTRDQRQRPHPEAPPPVHLPRERPHGIDVPISEYRYIKVREDSPRMAS